MASYIRLHEKQLLFYLIFVVRNLLELDSTTVFTDDDVISDDDGYRLRVVCCDGGISAASVGGKMEVQ